MSRRRQKSDRTDTRPAAKPLTETAVRKIEEWAAEAADSLDLLLYDVAVQPNWLVQIFVDRSEQAAPGQGVTVAECASVSRYVEGYLDVDGSIWQNYTLEVSSPGIERELTKPRHFELSLGQDAHFTVRRPIENRNVFEGKLLAFDGKVASVKCGPDEVVQIEWDNISAARLIHVFSEQ